jgi:hypothetical protein
MLRQLFKHSSPRNTKKSVIPISDHMTSNIDPAGLRALARLVNESIETIIAEYDKTNSTVPTLDDLWVGPFDAAEDATVALSDAIRILEGACAQLSYTCASPGYTITNVSINAPLDNCVAH